jgi:phosphatidate cytidylyltransferase
MNSLIKRSITGALFVFVLMGSIILSEISATIILSLFFVLGVFEFYTLFDQHEQIRLNKWINIAFSLAAFTLLILALNKIIPSIFALTAVPLVFIMNTTELWRKQKHPIQNMAIGTFGMVYLIAPFFLMIYLHHIDQYVIAEMDDKPYLPMLAGFFILVWTNDTFAYLTGMALGKRKLFERISPKKTWEGTIGGALFTVLGGFIISIFTETNDLTFWLIGAAFIAPLATIGDLLESQIKRSLNIKDSGNILPGHGGILDRFDAALFAIPIFASWVHFYIYYLN